MLIKYVFCFSLFFASLVYGSQIEQVHIVSYCPTLLPSEEVPYKYSLIRERFDVTFYHDLYKYVRNFKLDHSNLKKIIFLDYCEDPATGRLPHSKMICFKWEAIKIRPEFYNYYYRVYTFDDDLVDNIKFFKFYYPVLQPMILDQLSFGDKQLCVMIASNWIPERLEILDFFNTKPKDALHVYSRYLPFKYAEKEMYKGIIPGFHSGKAKIETLKNYRFCICFENTHTIPGYITEKIFDVFASGCVPIYWGPDNAENYIPSNCFINYKQFKNNEEMYDFIVSITASEYEQYIANIQKFLQSPEAYLFSQELFEEIIYQAVLD